MFGPAYLMYIEYMKPMISSEYKHRLQCISAP